MPGLGWLISIGVLLILSSLISDEVFSAEVRESTQITLRLVRSKKGRIWIGIVLILACVALSAMIRS